MNDAATRTPSGARVTMRRRVRVGLAVAGVVLAGVGGAVAVVRLGGAPVPSAQDVSPSVVDRNGKLLRAYAMRDGRWRLPVAATTDVDPRYLDMLIAYEDRRFRTHGGVDPLALLRAATQFARQGRIVSGGSTLTMQAARLIEPRGERSIAIKLRQMVRAWQLERALTKAEILDLYLTRAPFGGNLEGVRAASFAYFGKEPKRLTLGEAALLVALPQSPETRRPDRFPEVARRARDRVLDRMVLAGKVTAEDAARARAEPVPAARRLMPMLAPHAADQAVAKMLPAEGRPRVQLALDATLQQALEKLVRDRADGLGRDVAMGLVAIDHASGEVLARVGSPDYFDNRRAGQVDMTRALRSPGSTLKPFIYGMAFEDGFVHPESLIDDRPRRFGVYAPDNFDLTYQGTVTVRRALQMSLNVPAVALLERVGAHRLTARLTQAGGALVLPKHEVPGLAMGLGGVGVTLSDLVMLYGGIARLGDAVPLTARKADPQREPAARRLLDRVAAWQVGNVLVGTPPPDNAAPNRIAFKTGTSYGYRDAWAVGFDGRMTIGVWVGRPDGAPVPGMIGRSAAAPVLFDAFARSGKLIATLPKPPKGTLIATTARLPLPLQRFRPAGELIRVGMTPLLRIQFPLDGARIETLAETGISAGTLALKVAGGVAPMTVLVNGMPAGEIDERRQRLVTPPGPGFVRLTVMDAAGGTDTVVVRIQ